MVDAYSLRYNSEVSDFLDRPIGGADRVFGDGYRPFGGGSDAVRKPSIASPVPVVPRSARPSRPPSDSPTSSRPAAGPRNRSDSRLSLPYPGSCSYVRSALWSLRTLSSAYHSTAVLTQEQRNHLSSACRVHFLLILRSGSDGGGE